MKAVVYEKPRQFSVREVDVPQCGANQVLIKVYACGVCKTDIHIHNGSFISRFPLIPGHEFSGTIHQIGSSVSAFKPGDRVTADNTVLCSECYYCRRDEPLYCENFYSLGVNGPGGFAEYVLVNQDKVFPIADTLDFADASMTEPTACAIHGLDMIDLRIGDDVLIFGSGPTGIILAQLIKNGGAANVVVCAPSRFKLDLLREMGTAKTVVFVKNDYSKHERIIKEDFPLGFDVVVEATGYAPVVQHCFNYTKKGAKIIVYGVCDEADKISLNPYDVFAKELKIIGSFAQTHCFDRALKYLQNGVVKVSRLVTHRFALADYKKALETVMHSSQHMKVIIEPNQV